MALFVASCSSSAAFSAKKYDVFISFRGEDTRFNFTSHLRDAFRRKQIETYIDYRLHKGDEISASLLQAIEDSYVSVVVFSENYASSRWCLDELIHILQCKRDQGQIVIPVFYKVEPSHVRHQTRTYEQAFQKHERDLKHDQGKTHKWRTALTEVANIAGLGSLTIRDESELIQQIVTDVVRKLYHIYPPAELKGLVGVDKNCAEIDLLLREVQTVGIWGMGGIGKTTIARAIFVKCSSQYEGYCFLENVRENSGKHGNGLHDLRYRLVSQLLQEENLPVGTSIIESTFVKCRLRRKKVFVVLDDVSSLEQLEYLAGELDCFGAGSKIIITTRDKHVLSKRVDVIYEVKELEFRNSLHLFSLNAFNQSLPVIGYEELSERAVAYAKGIPLALKVLGSFLRSKSENEWNSALRKLKKIPNKNIQKVLRSSYDGLDRVDKKIFLHIACLLKGYFKKSVISILDSYKFYESIGYGAVGIKTLEDNTLITINKCHRVEMHDLIREMGWEIIREESIEEPGRRSLLWDPEEVYDVLTNNKDIVNLKVIDLSRSQKLIELPDFSKACKLELVVLNRCTNLRDVHPSILLLHSLIELWLIGCKKLESLKSEKHLRSLQHVHVGECSNLKEFSLSSEAMIWLSLTDSGIEILHSSIGHSSRLEGLYLDDLRLKNLHQLFCLRSLTELALRSCELIDDWTLHILFDSLLSLTSVCLDKCSNITELPSNIKHLSELRFLKLRNCKRLRSLPNLPPSIWHLDASNCTSLETVYPLKTDDGGYISFENCVKLDEQSLGSIIEDVYSSMMRTACMHNKYGFSSAQECSYCLPGSRVPECFEYRTRGGSITIELPPPSLLLGFLFCIAFDLPMLMDHVGIRSSQCYLGIGSQCYLGDFMVGMTKLPFTFLASKLKCDHVCLCYKADFCEEILERIEGRISDDEFVTNLTVSFKFDVGGNVAIVKERGVCPVYVSGGYEDFIRLKQLVNWNLPIYVSGRNNKRSRNVDEQQRLRQFKKLKLGLDIQSNTRRDIDELEAMFTRMNVTCNPDVIA